MKKKAKLLFPFLLCAALAGCAHSKTRSEQESASLTIVTATDLHYLSPELTDYGTGFMRMVSNGDGKLTQYAPEITDAFLEEVVRLRPDALILSGDLSFNGEKKSHEELADKLAAVEEAGIPVLVLPGNHDLNYPFAASFEKETVTRVERVTGEEFREIYGALGYREAAAEDRGSLSFLYELNDRVWFLLLDANTKEAQGALKESTLQWARQQLERAKAAGVSVITVTHQNILVHNELLSKGYVLGNHEETERLFKEFGVVLNLSGHVHIQHISEDEGFYDIATGSLAVNPNQYGLLEIAPDGAISYETRTVNVEKWDETKAGISGEYHSFAELSQAYFDECSRKKIEKEVSDLPVSAEEKREMTALAAEMNRDYFAGQMKPKEELTATEGWKLWKCEGAGLFFRKYMDTMLEAAGKEGNELMIR